MWLEKKYISLISSKLRNFKVKSNNPYLANFSCPFCGDSATNTRKARGYVFGNPLVYKCHNCGVPTNVPNLLKKVDPELHRKYIFEKFKKNDEPVSKIEIKKPIKQIINLESICIPIEKSSIGMQYIMKRKLPIDKIKDFYFLEEFKKITKILPKYSDSDEIPNDARIIIPIKNRIGEIIGISGRAINASKIRYVNLKVNEEPMIYNLDKVNLSRNINVVEGVFDSLFVENSVAVDGSDLKKILNISNNVTFVFDNQPRNKIIINKMIEIAKEDYRIVVWPEWIEEYGKDINEMVLNGLDILTINEIIYKHSYTRLNSLLKISKWRKI